MLSTHIGKALCGYALKLYWVFKYCEERVFKREYKQEDIILFMKLMSDSVELLCDTEEVWPYV